MRFDPVALANISGMSCFHAMLASTMNSGSTCKKAMNAMAKPRLTWNCAASAPHEMSRAAAMTPENDSVAARPGLR
jgi:hypothetical protein